METKSGNLLGTSLSLDAFGAPGFEIRERLDFSGHKSGLVTPHVNADVYDSSGTKLSREYRDLTSNQLPGFNGMQVSND